MVIRNSQQLSFEENNNFKPLWSLYCTVTQWPKVKEKYFNVTYISAPSPFFSLWFQIEQWNLYVDSTCTCSYMYKFIMYKSFLMFSPCVQTLHILVRFFSRHFICKRFTFLLYKTPCGLHVHCIIFILDLRTSKYLTFEIF